MQTYVKPELAALGSLSSLTQISGDSEREDTLVWASRGTTLLTATGYLDACLTNPDPTTGDPCL
jgi:hypothetical protein